MPSIYSMSQPGQSARAPRRDASRQQMRPTNESIELEKKTFICKAVSSHRPTSPTLHVNSRVLYKLLICRIKLLFLFTLTSCPPAVDVPIPQELAEVGYKRATHAGPMPPCRC